MATEQDSLYIGDYALFYSEDVYGYVTSYQSSIFSEIAVAAKQHRFKPSVCDINAIAFELCSAKRYKLNKNFRKLKEKAATHPKDVKLRNQCYAARVAAEAENADNDLESKRHRGKKLLYGQIVQLRHLFSGKYVHVSTTQTSSLEANNLQMSLQPYNAKHAQFRVMPRYKVKAEGDIVQVEDQVVFESVKSPGQFFHVSKAVFKETSVYSGSHEVNLSVRQSGLTVYRLYRPNVSSADKLKTGDVVRLFHKEIEAYLVAEGLFGDTVTEEVHLRVRAVDQNNPKTLFPSTSAITYWQLEPEEGVRNAGVIIWGQQIRIRHMCTRKYLLVAGDKLQLCDDHRDPRTVFRLHPVIVESDEIMYDTYCRIEHVVSGHWIQALPVDYKRKERENMSAENADFSLAGLQWTTAETKQAGMSEEKQYDDAFTLQKVDSPLIQIFSYAAGMAPFIQKLIDVRSSNIALSPKDYYLIISALHDLKQFMVVHSEPSKDRQKLLRNLRIIDLLVKLVQMPIRGSTDYHSMARVFVAAYDVLHAYLLGNSRKNELYIAKHIEFFQSQINVEGDIGLSATNMVMELIKDSRKIVDRITQAHIQDFVHLLRKKKNYRYLDLLGVLCVCDGMAIPENQKYITEIWLCDKEAGTNYHLYRVRFPDDRVAYQQHKLFMSTHINCVYLTELGQKINREENVVYVSTTHGRMWTALPEFIQKAEKSKTSRGLSLMPVGVRKPLSLVDSEPLDDAQALDELLFLEHQLLLFGKLCYGRNDFAIHVISEELNYLTWEEAFICLSDRKLPDSLRANYCNLIISLFVDVGGNFSILDRVNLTFIYDELRSKEAKEQRVVRASMGPKEAITMACFANLRPWMSDFLDHNKDMTASEISHNILIEAVLKLLHYLVKYGYYNRFDDIQKLLGPLLSLLDGRNDKPHQISKETDPAVLTRYRQVTRYRPSPETKAIANAKIQALEVLDLFFNFRFNTRLEAFASEFRKVYEDAHSVTKSSSELFPLLNEDFDIELNGSSCKSANKRLDEIFAESAYFRSFPIVDVLLDLTNYKYPAMVSAALRLLNRFYSAHEILFKRAIQAQVLITETSCETMHRLRQMLPVLHRYAMARVAPEHTGELSSIIENLIRFCHLEGEPEEPHPMNQTILYNHDVLNDLFDILAQEMDIRLLDDDDLEPIMLECCSPAERRIRMQYKNLRAIFENCFILLKSLARQNEVVQSRLFDRLDLLLSVPGAESHMAVALTEVFTGNKATCLRVLPRHIQRIMMLSAKLTTAAPELLDLLNAIVKVEELDLPLKRNQGYVMKYFMQYRSDIAMVLDDKKTRALLLEKGSTANVTEELALKSRYLIGLVNLLATCAEGENRFIESICQTIITVDDLVSVLNNTHYSSVVKLCFLRYFVWVYLNTASGMLESGTSDLGTDERIWNFISNISDEVSTVIAFAKQNKDTTRQLLKQPLFGVGSGSALTNRESDEERRHMHETLHLMFEGIFPFLQVFFRTYYMPQSADTSKIKELADALIQFSGVMTSLVTSSSQLKVMSSATSTVISISNLPAAVVSAYQAEHGRKTYKTPDLRSEARKIYDEKYEGEEKLNDALNVFADNYRLAYGGRNDVKTQIGYNGLSAGNVYTEIDGDEELPLGPEFQNHIACFVNSSAKTTAAKYRMTSKLIEQLHVSSTIVNLSEKQRIERELLDVKSLRILRATIHNEIVKLPLEWEKNPRLSQDTLAKIEEVQDALNNNDAILKILSHLNTTSDDVIKEVLAFMAAILFAGNPNVQNSLDVYFKGTREEMFFFAIKGRMELSSISTKEKRILMAQHRAKVDEALQQARALRKAVKAGTIGAEEAYANSVMNIRESLQNVRQPSKAGGQRSRKSSSRVSRPTTGVTAGNGTVRNKGGKPATPKSKVSPEPVKQKKLPLEERDLERNGDVEEEDYSVPEVKIVPSSVENTSDGGAAVEEDDNEAEDELNIEEILLEAVQNDLGYKDDGYIELVLRVLGYICDGQNQSLQDYLREQPDNIKSVNLVSEVARYLGLVYSSINSQSISLVTELFSTLNEFASGNFANQVVIYENKVCDYINYIIRGGGTFSGCTPQQVTELKLNIGRMVKSLIEENPHKSTTSKSVGVVKEVADLLDVQSFFMLFVDCYKHYLSKNQSTSELRELYLETGFTYFHVICRIQNLESSSDADSAPEKTISKKNLCKTQLDIAAWDFYANSTLSVEVLKNNELQKICFRVKDESVLREEVKEKFKYEVDRSSPSNKLRDFVEWSRDIMNDIKYQQKILSNPLARFFVRFWYQFNITAILLSFVICVFTLISWKERPSSSEYPNRSDPRPDYEFESARTIIFVLGIIHNIVSTCILISYLLSNNPTILGSVPSAFLKLLGKEKPPKSHLEVRFFSVKTFYYIVFFVMSILGSFFYGYFFAFHLLHIAENNQLLKRAIQAITRNGRSLLWVAVLGLALLYIFTLIAFAHFRSIFKDDNFSFCNSLRECLVTVIRRGLIEGIYDYLTPSEGNTEPFSYWVGKAVLDVTFFIIITTIGLNIVFGIIVDTFSELRDSKWQIDQDMTSYCFICNRSSYDFEHQGVGFEHHVKFEHNQWAYLFFFIHLDETRSNDYTSIELYVSRLLERDSRDFFPLNRALSLQQDEESSEAKLETITKQINYIISKLKEEESERRREEEAKKQREWIRQHKTTSQA